MPTITFSPLDLPLELVGRARDLALGIALLDALTMPPISSMRRM